MSYILDALKKSEQERGSGAVPSVQTIHSSSLNYHQEKRSIWPWVIALALIANMAILVYFLKPETDSKTPAMQTTAYNQTTAAQATTDTINEIKPEPTVAPAEAITPVSNRPATEQTFSASTGDIIEQPAGNITTASTAPVVSIDELPDNIQQQIPAMVFSAHVYSSDAMQRSLVINNRFMEEGETVIDGLMLVEITPQGAVFSFRDYRFSVSVLSGWGTN